MKFSELVATSGHAADHVEKFTLTPSDATSAEVKRHPSLLVFVEDMDADLALLAVSEDGNALEFVPASLQSNAVVLAAIESEPKSFRFSHNRDTSVLDAAVAASGDNLMYLSTSEKTQDRCVAAVGADTSAIRYCNPAVFDPEETQSAQAAAVQPDPHSSGGY